MLIERLVISAVLLLVTTWAAAQPVSKWQQYQNAQCAYHLHYPADSKIASASKKDLKQHFYLDPLQYIHALQTHFNNYFVNSAHCKTQIKLPIKQQNTNLDRFSLLILKLHHIPKNWNFESLKKQPLMGEQYQQVTINGSSIWRVTTQDAAMCHHLSNTYYWIRHGDVYYVLNFILESHCLGITEAKQQAFDPEPIHSTIQRIVSSFQVPQYVHLS